MLNDYASVWAEPQGIQSVCVQLQRGEYLMRRPLPARVMEEDTSPFARQPKNAISAQSHPPARNPLTPIVQSF